MRMKKVLVWFCRDKYSGNVSVWDGNLDKPKPNLFIKGEWNAYTTKNKKWDGNNTTCLANDTEEAARMFGEGFHGIGYGRCKKILVMQVRGEE